MVPFMAFSIYVGFVEEKTIEEVSMTKKVITFLIGGLRWLFITLLCPLMNNVLGHVITL